MRKLLASSAGTLGTGIFLILCGGSAAKAEEADRRALFGDLHVHTRYSFDAFIFGTRTTPDDAYEFAKGRAIEHPGGFELQLVNFAGEAIDAAYAETRMRNEPLVEVTQVKGTSDTHPFLSPNDEWADFEIMPYRIAQWNRSRPRGSYVRDAYQRGLKLQAERGVNPYRFGLVGASDTHNGGASLDESNFVAKVGVLDATAELRGSVPMVSEEGVTAYNDTYYKTWSEEGKAREQVFDVACSDGLEPDPETYRCPDNGADVDLSDCSITPDKGAAELVAVWRDPTYATGQHAFYYLRALENPTCRWSTWDAVKAGVEPRPQLPATIQERAWSSPIWVGGPPTQ